MLGGAQPEGLGDEPLNNVASDTPWGNVSAVPRMVSGAEHSVLLLNRHGDDHTLAPHQINYRANIWLMRELGVDAVIGTHTVGSIDPALQDGWLVLPEQLIDYTWGRASTFDDQRRHVEFSNPYDAPLQQRLQAIDAGITIGGTYGCTQGPRLETAAEIQRMAQDGCTLVGMTGMPEAGLARELQLPYVSLCLVVNPAAGIVDAPIDMQRMRAVGERGAAQIAQVLAGLL